MTKKIKFIGIVLVILILTNTLSRYVYKRFDITANHRYTLSEPTQQLLKNIDNQLLIKVYLEGDFPAEFKRLQTETRQFLEELQAKNSAIVIQFINPKQIQKQLIQKGLFPSKLTVEENGKLSKSIIFPWAEIIYKNKTTHVSLLPNSQTTSQEEQLENAISNLEFSFASNINSIISSKRQKIAVLNGNGELKDIRLYSFLSEIKSKYNLAKFTLDSVAKKPNQTLEKLNKFDLAIIAKPTEKFSDKEKLVLDQFITNGGKTIWMIDANISDTDSLYNDGKMMAYPRDLNITDMLFGYGIRISNKLIKDLYASKITLATGNIGNQTQFQSLDWGFHPLAIGNPKHPITKNILPIRLRFTTTLDTLPRKNIKTTPLLVSSNFTQQIGTPTIIELKSIANQTDKNQYTSGSKLFAVLLEGNFISAYNDRIKPFEIQKFQQQNSTSNKMIIIADGDIGKNQILKDNPYDLGVDKWTQQRFGNKDFLTNAVSYLLDNNRLIELRNKVLKIHILDKQKIYSEKTFWQLLNVGTPIIVLIIFGILSSYYRKRKYQ